MSQDLLRSLIWTDYRLAVLFTVIIPLLLSVWCFVQRADAIQRLFVIYWRVSSLLAITVYLMIGGFPFSFMAGFLARILIPVSLWFWVDLNEELDDMTRTPLRLAFTSWRWAVSVYNVLGAIALVPFLRCAFSTGEFSNASCQLWLEAPLLYREYFHANLRPEFLGFALGIPALVIYVLYLGHFVLIRLGKQGRTAIQQ